MFKEKPNSHLDTPSVLHHVIFRCMKRQNIVKDIKAGNNPLKHLSDLRPAITTITTTCYIYLLLTIQTQFFIPFKKFWFIDFN